MNKPPLRVVRFSMWYHPAMAERFAREPDITLQTCELQGADDGAWSELAEAHAYQISSAKDEIPQRWFANAELLRRSPKLLCVSANGAGCDTIDIPACTEAGVLVVNQAGANAQSVAEHAIGAMLDVARRMTESDRLLRKSRGFSREDLMGVEMSGKTLGLVGIGNIGTKVARMAAAFDMKVLATDPYLSAEEAARRGAESVSLDELLRRSDFISLHCPRDSSTMRMIDARAYSQMKRGAIFVSTARGGIHDETALAEALSSGHLGGAALDVWDVEPPPLDHPLLRFDNVLATYHTSGVTPEARGRMGSFAADQIVELLRGKRPSRLLNPDALPLFRQRFQALLCFPFADQRPLVATQD
jgi:D-3-phosphoglycerate dehydrogenase / 2-oxoglutarate reductase